MSGAKAKRAALSLLTLGAGGFVLCLAGAWFQVEFRSGVTVSISGAEAAGASLALGLASLALAGALLLSRGALRTGLAAVGVLLGLGSVLLLVPVLSNPVAAAELRLGEVLGVTGPALLAEIVSVQTEPLAWIGLALSLLGAVGAAIAVRSANRWPDMTSRYEARGRSDDAAGRWDALSEGEDPTTSTPA